MNVFIIAAMSVDGFIAKSSDELINWTSKEDKMFFSETTRRAGVMVMGGNTFRTFKSLLPDRRHIVYTTQNVTTPGVEITTQEPKRLIERLESEGVNEVAICGGRSIYTMFLSASVVNELYLTVEPLLFGNGISLINNDVDVKLSLKSVNNLNKDTVLLKYKVQ